MFDRLESVRATKVVIIGTMVKGVDTTNNIGMLVGEVVELGTSKGIPAHTEIIDDIVVVAE